MKYRNLQLLWVEWKFPDSAPQKFDVMCQQRTCSGGCVDGCRARTPLPIALSVALPPRWGRAGMREDAVNLALEIGIDTVDHLKDLFNSFFPGETLHSGALARLPELAEEIQLRRTE